MPVSTLLPTAIPDPTEGQHASGVSAPWTGTKPGYPEETSENKAGRGVPACGSGGGFNVPGVHASWFCLRLSILSMAREPGFFSSCLLPDSPACLWLPEELCLACDT